MLINFILKSILEVCNTRFRSRSDLLAATVQPKLREAPLNWRYEKVENWTSSPFRASYSQILVVLCMSMCESLRFTQSNLQHWQFGFNTCALGENGAGVSKKFPRDAMPCDAFTLTHMSLDSQCDGRKSVAILIFLASSKLSQQQGRNHLQAPLSEKPGNLCFIKVIKAI